MHDISMTHTMSVCIDYASRDGGTSRGPDVLGRRKMSGHYIHFHFFQKQKNLALQSECLVYSHMTMECKKHLSYILYGTDCSCGVVISTSYQESYILAIEAPLTQVEVYVYKGRRFPMRKNLWMWD